MLSGIILKVRSIISVAGLIRHSHILLLHTIWIQPMPNTDMLMKTSTVSAQVASEQTADIIRAVTVTPAAFVRVFSVPIAAVNAWAATVFPAVEVIE